MLKLHLLSLTLLARHLITLLLSLWFVYDNLENKFDSSYGQNMLNKLEHLLRVTNFTVFLDKDCEVMSTGVRFINGISF